MITALDIQNIQSHEKTELIFHPGVNVIVGPSDSGKTGILRSIRLAVWNRPSGTSVCSLWGGTSLVKLYTEEGSIIRHKGKVDKYILKIRGENEQEFKAIGTGVPEEISRFLNLSEINLQRQLDSPFLLSESAGDVAKHFNVVSKLDKIDIATSGINSEIRTLTTDIAKTEQLEAELVANLKDFTHLEKFEIDIEVLEEMEKQLNSARVVREKLMALCVSYQEVDAEILVESELLPLESFVDTILEDIQKYKEATGKEDQLKRDITKIKTLDDKIKDKNLILSGEKLTDNTLALIKQEQEAITTYNKFCILLQEIDFLTKQIGEQQINLELMISEFDSVFPDVCPLCNKPK